MSKTVTARVASFVVAMFALPLVMAMPATAACPDPSTYLNYEFSATYQPYLAQIKFTPAVSQTVAAKLASPSNPLLSTNVTIAILDGYADTRHVDLCGHETTYFAYAGAYTTYDLHGTHVSGLAGGIQNSAGLVGVDPFARLLNIPVFDDNGWVAGDLGQAALNYASSQGARVVNMSYGSTKRGAVFLPGELNLFRNYNSSAAGQGLLIVRAAGNDGRTIANQGYAGNASVDLSNLLIVGSVNSSNKISYFSNRPGNACMTSASCSSNPANYVKNFFIVAPGENIWSDAPNDSIARLSGTSMATPIVAGAAGLVIQYALAGNTPLTPGQVANILKLSAKHLGNSPLGTPDSIYGWGLLDVDAAINRPAGSSSIATQSTVNGGLVPFNQSMLSTSTTAMIRTSVDDALSDMVIFDSFGRPFLPVGSKMTTPTSNVAASMTSLAASTAALHKVTLREEDGWHYALTSGDRGSVGSDLTVLSIAGEGLHADVGLGGAWSYFSSAALASEQDGSTYSRDLARQFFDGSGDASAALRDAAIFAAVDYDVSPDMTVSSVLMKTEPDSVRTDSIASEDRTGIYNQLLDEDAKNSTLMKVGGVYRIRPDLSAGGSFGVMIEEGAALGLQSSGAFSLGGRTLTRIFGVNLKYETGDASSIQLFADQSITSSTHGGASIFSPIDNWRGSKFGLAYEAGQLLDDSDALRITVARSWQVDRGSLALHVPVGRELDGTVDYADRIVSVDSNAVPVEFGLQYRGASEFCNYALALGVTDRDVVANGELEYTAAAALQFSF